MRIAATLVILALLSTAAYGQQAVSARQLLVEGGRALAQGQHDQALKACQAAFDLAATDDERAQALFGMANVYRSRGDVAQQISRLRQVEALPRAQAPFAQAARRQLALLYREAGDWAAARTAFEKLLAAAENPDERLSYNLDLAQLDVQQNKPAEAVKRLQPFLQDAQALQGVRELYSTLIVALVAANQPDQALTLARQALRQFPDRGDIVTGAAQALAERGQLDQAAALLQEALLANPQQDDMLRTLHGILQQRDRLARLTDWLEKQAHGAGEAIWLTHLAHVHEWAGQLPEALDAYARLLALKPKDGARLQQGAQLALRANDPTRAEQWLRQAQALQPEDESLATLLGEALLKQGKLQPALATWRKGLGYAAGDAQSVRRLGGVLMRYELYEAALDAYREGRQASGQREAYALNMANAYEKLGQTTEAVREYAIALTSHDRTQPAGAAISQLYRLAEEDGARPTVTAALMTLRQQGELPTEGLGVLLFARALQGDDGRQVLAELAPDNAPETTRRELTNVLLRVGNELETREQAELALPFYERVIRDAGTDDYMGGMAQRVAELQLKGGNWRGALGMLQQALAGPRVGNLPPAQRAGLALKLGDVLLRQARRPTDAVGAYEMAAKAAPEGMSARLAQWGEADALFALGKFDQALEAYGRLLNLPRGGANWDLLTVPGLPGPPAQTVLPADDYVAYQQAEALLREGQFEKAAPAFHKLAADHADSAYANDALQRVLLLNRLQQDKAGAQAYVAAVKAWAQGDADAAVTSLRPLTETATTPLSDAGLMMLAEIRVWQGDLAQAVAAYDRLLAQEEKSPLAPQAAFTAAMLVSKQDRAAARGRLQALVETFPDTTEAEEAGLVLQAWGPGK